MSENLKQFKSVITEALIAYFKDRDDHLTGRYAQDSKTKDVVRDYSDATVDSMTGEIKASAWEEGGVTFVTFNATQDGKDYTLMYRADTTLMNIVVEVAMES